MAKQKTSRVPRPNAFLYYTVGFFAGLYYRWVHGLRVDRSAIRGIKPPFLVIAGHTSWLDFMTVTIALYPRRMNYLAAYNFYRYRTLKFFLGLMGVIPKYQFTSDTRAIIKAKNVISRNGILAILPHGCLSNDGRPGGFAASSTAKLIKMFKIPVIAVQINGGVPDTPPVDKESTQGAHCHNRYQNP